MSHFVAIAHQGLANVKLHLSNTCQKDSSKDRWETHVLAPLGAENRARGGSGEIAKLTNRGAMQPPEAVQPSDSPRPRIVLIGASARSATESARRAGFDPFVIDQFGDRETRQVAEDWHSLAEATPEWRRTRFAEFARSAPLAFVGGLSAGYADWNAPERRFFGACPKTFHTVSCPRFLRQTAAFAGTQFPSTSSAIQTEPGWLVKRRGSCGGLHVHRCDAETVLQNDEYVQAFQRGRIVGLSFLGMDDRALLLGACGLLKKRIESRRFVFAGAVGPLEFSPEITDQFQALGSGVLSFHFDARSVQHRCRRLQRSGLASRDQPAMERVNGAA